MSTAVTGLLKRFRRLVVRGWNRDPIGYKLEVFRWTLYITLPIMAAFAATLDRILGWAKLRKWDWGSAHPELTPNLPSREQQMEIRRQRDKRIAMKQTKERENEPKKE